jgi:hypothetical protein
MKNFNKIFSISLLVLTIISTINLYPVQSLQEDKNANPFEKEASEGIPYFYAIKKFDDLLFKLIIEDLFCSHKPITVQVIIYYNTLIGSHRNGLQPNPYSNQTVQGLFLEVKNNQPYALWTPWGNVILTGGNKISPEGLDWKSINNKFLIPIKDQTLKKFITKK